MRKREGGEEIEKKGGRGRVKGKEGRGRDKIKKGGIRRDRGKEGRGRDRGKGEGRGEGGVRLQQTCVDRKNEQQRTKADTARVWHTR